MKTKLLLLLIVICMLSIAAPAHAAEEATASSISKTVLSNGLTIITKEEPGSGIVAIEAFVKVGAAEERESEVGIGNMVVKTLLAGTRNLRSERLAQYVDEAGGNFETQWNPDYTELRAITSSRHFNDVMNLVGEVLVNARFDTTEVEKVRQDILSGFKTSADNIFQTAYTNVRDQLYSENPYKRPASGYSSVIQKLTLNQIEQFYRSYFIPNNMVISVAGDVKADKVVDRVKMAFAGTDKKALPRDRSPVDESLERSSFRAMQRPIGAAYVMMGFLAPGMKSPDYPAAAVASAALGSGKGSRMFVNVREKQGIGYDLGTAYPQLRNQSHILAYVVTDPYKMNIPGLMVQPSLDEAKNALIAEVKRMETEPLTPAELERAKKYTIGSYALKHQRLRERAFHLGWLETIGLGYQYDQQLAEKVEAVTQADVQRVVSKYMRNYGLVVILPKDDKPASGG